MACTSALPHAAKLGMATRQGRGFARTPATWMCAAREVLGNDFILLPPSGSGKSRVAHGEDQRGPKQLTPVVVGQYDWDSYLGASATRPRMAACQESPAGGKCFPGIPWALPPSDGCGRSPPPEIRHSCFLLKSVKGLRFSFARCQSGVLKTTRCRNATATSLYPAKGSVQ